MNEATDSDLDEAPMTLKDLFRNLKSDAKDLTKKVLKLDIQKFIETFLRLRGLSISEKKTRIIAATKGFDFLGWHFKVLKDGQFKSTPLVRKKNFS